MIKVIALDLATHCNGPHLIKDCNETACLRCKPNLNNHTPSKCPRRCLSNQPFNHNGLNKNTTRNTHETNSYTEPSLQCLVLTSKPDQMAELLEATKKMIKCFKRSLKCITVHTNTNDHYQKKKNPNKSHSDKCKYKPHYHIVHLSTHQPKLMTHQTTLI